MVWVIFEDYGEGVRFVSVHATKTGAKREMARRARSLGQFSWVPRTREWVAGYHSMWVREEFLNP